MTSKKPLILDFIESKAPDEDYQNALKQVEYSPKLNLTVLKGTKKPAVFEKLSIGTDTFTKATSENSDLDRDIDLGHSLSTTTMTNVRSEPSYADQPFRYYLSTMTLTQTKAENLDCDK